MYKPFTRGTIVSLSWVDSKSYKGWSRDEERHPAELRSVGFVVSNNPIRIVLSTTINEADRYTIDDIVIPWSAISQASEIK